VAAAGKAVVADKPVAKAAAKMAAIVARPLRRTISNSRGFYSMPEGASDGRLRLRFLARNCFD
jgi:hypothetical protein